jgi:ADP-ribosylglycohydrolase
MYGAILGDIIGSPFEFDRGNKSKEFDLFSKGAAFTDDSVMTVAVAEALLDAGKDASPDKIRSKVISSMQKWGKKYPYAGYGGRFRGWLSSKHPAPYGSYGNGSAMRVSAVGWLYDTLERTREVARATAVVTHNHPEGIKGAESVASAIYLARTGSSKNEIKVYIEKTFHYNLRRTCDEIRPSYHHVESCQQTVPEAITAFLEGTDFEDVIRTAVSLGGDCDTLTAIAGSIAEAFYGIPALLRSECRERLPEDLLEVVKQFDQVVGMKDSKDSVDPFLDGNQWLEEAIKLFHQNTTKENLIRILEVIRRRMHEDGHLLIPVEPPKAAFDMLDVEHIQVGDTVQTQEDLHFSLRRIETNDGRQWLVAFTNQEEQLKGESTSIISNFIDSYLEAVLDMEDIAGIIINPWGQQFLLDKNLIQAIFDADKQEGM